MGDVLDGALAEFHRRPDEDPDPVIADDLAGDHEDVAPRRGRDGFPGVLEADVLQLPVGSNGREVSGGVQADQFVGLEVADLAGAAPGSPGLGDRQGSLQGGDAGDVAGDLAERSGRDCGPEGIVAAEGDLDVGQAEGMVDEIVHRHPSEAFSVVDDLLGVLAVLIVDGDGVAEVAPDQEGGLEGPAVGVRCGGVNVDGRYLGDAGASAPHVVGGQFAGGGDRDGGILDPFVAGCIGDAGQAGQFGDARAALLDHGGGALVQDPVDDSAEEFLVDLSGRGRILRRSGRCGRRRFGASFLLRVEVGLEDGSRFVGEGLVCQAPGG